LYGISKLPPPLSSPLEGEDVRRGGIIYCMEFQSYPHLFPPPLRGRM